MFASTGRDTRPQEVEASAPARLRLESLGWLVFYGAIRRAVHSVTKQVTPPCTGYYIRVRTPSKVVCL